MHGHSSPHTNTDLSSDLSQPVSPHPVADLFETIQALKAEVQGASLSSLTVVNPEQPHSSAIAVITQLEAQLNAYTEQNQRHLQATEERVERQLQAFRQHFLLTLGELDTHLAAQIQEKLSLLEMDQRHIHHQVQTISQQVAIQHHDLLDVQTQLTHHIDYTEDRLDRQQDSFLKLLLVGIAVALGCLALPLGLEWASQQQQVPVEPLRGEAQR
ncbi:MAG: hypothetical protein EA366_09490 [Spirulina sp. DLM2.Bin59]|nr:MAG: hypothetical protein EA366_09490 [Spirulina sp. DLM2.Bin59]